MYCEKCGTKQNPDSAFCRNCGAPQPLEQPVSPALQQVNPAPESLEYPVYVPDTPVQPSPLKPRPPVSVGAVILLGIALVLLIWSVAPFISTLDLYIKYEIPYTSTIIMYSIITVKTVFIGLVVLRRFRPAAQFITMALYAGLGIVYNVVYFIQKSNAILASDNSIKKVIEYICMITVAVFLILALIADLRQDNKIKRYATIAFGAQMLIFVMSLISRIITMETLKDLQWVFLGSEKYLIAAFFLYALMRAKEIQSAETPAFEEL